MIDKIHKPFLDILDQVWDKEITQPLKSKKIKTTNPYSGQSEMLTPEEHKLYTQVKQDEIDERYDAMQKGLDKFSRLNPKAYMTLLD